MADTPNLKAKIDDLVTQYDKVLKMCYDALAADAPQENRDALREAIEDHFKPSDGS
jgi:hypothetical protein